MTTTTSISNAASDEEIVLETTEKTENTTSPTTDDNNISNSDSPFHLLEGRWTFWYTHRPTTFRNSAVNYDSCLKKLGLFSQLDFDPFVFLNDFILFTQAHLVQ